MSGAGNYSSVLFLTCFLEFLFFSLAASLSSVMKHSTRSHGGSSSRTYNSREKREIALSVNPTPVECVQTDLKPVKTFLSCRSGWALGTGARRAACVLAIYEKLVIGSQN